MVRHDDENIWGLINSRLFDSTESDVACRMLGLSPGLSPYRHQHWDSQNPYYFSRLSCKGLEESLTQCRYNEQMVLAEDVADDTIPVGITCLPENTTLEIRFDLMNETEIQTGGLVEVFDGVETWGYICSYGWIFDDGNIACIHMGYPGAMAAYSIDVSYHRKTHYSLTNIICSAYRGFSSIDECLFVQFKEENCLCEPQRVAGVVCAIDEADIATERRLVQEAVNLRVRDDGIVEGQIFGADDDNWRVLCLVDTVNDYYHETMALNACMDELGEGVSDHRKIEREDELDMHLTDSTDSLLIGSIGTSTTGVWMLSTPVPVPGPCSRFGYSATYAKCKRTIPFYSLGVQVYSGISCVNRCGYRPGNINCRCDPECKQFHDCCLDYREVCMNETTPSTDNYDNPSSISPPPPDATYDCFAPSRDIPDARLISRCSGGSQLHYFRSKCEYETSSSLLLQTWPVYDRQGINYRNIYCALCNGQTHFDYDHWDVYASTDFIDRAGQLGSQGRTYGLLPSPARGKRRRRRNTNEQCGSDAYARDTDDGGYDGMETLIKVGHRLRFCDTDVISTCPPDYGDLTIVQGCSAYDSHLCHKYDPAIPTYRNLHCLICNGVELDENIVSCEGHKKYAPSMFADFRWNFLNVTDDSQEAMETPQRVICPRNQVHDLATGECRIQCPSGYQYQEGRCVLIQSATANILDGLNCVYQLAEVVFSGTTIADRDSTLECILHELYPDMDNDVSLNKRYLSWGEDQQSGVILSSRQENASEIVHRVDMEMGPDKDEVLEALETECSVRTFETLYTCKKRDVVDACTLNWYYGVAQDFERDNETNGLELFRFRGVHIAVDRVFSQAVYDYNINTKMFVKYGNLLVCGRRALAIEHCKLKTVLESEYIMANDSLAIYLTLTGQSFDAEHLILLPDGRAQVCENEIIMRASNDEEHFERNISTYRFLDFPEDKQKRGFVVGSMLSLTGIVATLALFLFNPELRKDQGHGVISLLLSVFVGQLLMMLSKVFSTPSLFKVCLAMSMVSHYAWLAAFNWMTVLVTQLAYRVVSRKVSAQADCDLPSCRETVVTNAVGWGVPLLIVGVSVILHIMGSDLEFLLRYGGECSCWITNGTADLLAFGVPAGVSLVCSVIAFICAGLIYRKARDESSDLRGGIDWEDGLAKLSLYLRMCIPLAAVWITCYLAVFIEANTLWWLYVASNAALGVIIFTYSATNRRTRAAWENRLRGATSVIQDSSMEVKASDKRGSVHVHAPVVNMAAINVCAMESDTSEGECSTNSASLSEDNVQLEEKSADPKKEDVVREDDDAVNGVDNKGANFEEDNLGV